MQATISNYGFTLRIETRPSKDIKQYSPRTEANPLGALMFSSLAICQEHQEDTSYLAEQVLPVV